MANLIVRDFGVHGVRIVMRDGAPWFVAADVCAALDIGNVSMAVARLDADERTLISAEGLPAAGLGLVSESGLYALVLGSRKPEAKSFKRWVTHEVLPSIRKTGSYGAPADPLAALADPSKLRELLLGYTERVLALEANVAELAPKAESHDALMGSADTLGFRAAVKVLHRTTAVRESEVRTLMFERRWIQRLDGALMPASYGEQRGYVTARVTEYTTAEGEQRSRSELRITPKGLERLRQLLTAADAA